MSLVPIELERCSESSRDKLLASYLGYVEVAAVFARRQSVIRKLKLSIERLNRDLKSDWDRFDKLVIDDQVFEMAVIVAQTFRLRGADAMHLATALVANRRLVDRNNDIVVLTADRELLAASMQAGLGAQDPSADVLKPM